MNKRINNFLLFLALLILYITFSETVIILMHYLGFNINSLSIHKKNICLIIIDIILMIIFYLIYFKDNNTELKRYSKNLTKFLLFGLKMWVIGAILMFTSNILINHFYPTSIATNEEAVQKLLKVSPIYTAFSACIFAPFVEEMIFRKALRKVFNNSIIFIIISGLAFGFIHNISNIGSHNMIYIIPYGLFGSIFAYTYVKTKSIFVPITFHLMHNTILVIISLYQMGVI